jgi:hypothetical protein
MSRTSGPTPGIVSQRTRLTTRRKPVRTARKSGSTWAPSFSGRRRARRSCISSGIVIIHGRFDCATSSFRQARRFNAGMTASDELLASRLCHARPLDPCDSSFAEWGEVFSPRSDASFLLHRCRSAFPRGRCGAIHDRPSITCVAPAAPIDRVGVRLLLRRSRGDAEKRHPEKKEENASCASSK